jgi:outer membrane protein assembly factor BamB
VLVGDLVIQNCDSDVDAYIVGLDKKTGKTVWRTARPDNRGWSTPVLVTANGRQELAVNGHSGVRAYDPKTGKELWFCKSFNGRGEPTVTPGFGLLFTVNGLAGDIYAIKTGGDGDVTKSHMAWHTPRKGARDTPSPILVDRFLTVMDMKGVATCYDAITGKELWKDRVGGNFSASPIASGGYIYFLSEAGETVVMKPGSTMDIVARNVLSSAADDELFRASLTPCDGQVLIRSNQVLYCIGKKGK